MPKLLFDASVYIRAFREKRLQLLGSRALGRDLIYFSAVVGSELLRCANERNVIRIVEELWRDFKKAGRNVLPGIGDWHEAGIVLAKMRAKLDYESVGQAKLVHDTLIAVSARRLGISVVTHNVGDFQRIAEIRKCSILSLGDLQL